MTGIQRSQVHAPGDLGLAIQQARLRRGVTQVELAEQLGVSQRSISEIETGKTTIHLRKLFDLLDATGVELTASWTDEASDVGTATADTSIDTS